MIDFGSMEPDAQIRFMRHNCYITIWPLYPIMPVVKGTPMKIDTIKDYGFLDAKDVHDGKLIVHAGVNIALMLMGLPQDGELIHFKSEQEMANAGWRIDE
jgi:hypothetical protein